jgi:hypothetical protein
LRAVESNAGMVPVKGIVGYGRFTARGEFVVFTQHRGSLNESGTPRAALRILHSFAQIAAITQQGRSR